MTRKTLGILALSAVLAMSLMAGCTPKNDGGSASSAGSSAPSSSAPVSEPSSEPENNGDEGDAAGGTVFGEADEKLTAAYNAAKKALGETGFVYNPMDDTAQLEGVYGVSPDLVKSAIVEVPMISAQAGYFVGIRAADGKGEEVEKALAAFRDKMAEDTLQYPMNIQKVAAGEVYREGDYVFYVVLGDADKAMDMEDAEQLEHYKAENQKAIDAIKEALK